VQRLDVWIRAGNAGVVKWRRLAAITGALLTSVHACRVYDPDDLTPGASLPPAAFGGDAGLGGGGGGKTSSPGGGRTGTSAMGGNTSGASGTGGVISGGGFGGGSGGLVGGATPTGGATHQGGSSAVAGQSGTPEEAGAGGASGAAGALGEGGSLGEGEAGAGGAAGEPGELAGGAPSAGAPGSPEEGGAAGEDGGEGVACAGGASASGGTTSKGGSGGAASGGAPGSGGAGTGGSSSVSRLLIDDCEDGNHRIILRDGRNGYWATFDDGTEGATVFPAVGKSDDFMSSTRANTGTGEYAVRFSAEGFVFGAGVGFEFISGKEPYELASEYAGIAFGARASDAPITIHVRLPVVATVLEGGLCEWPGETGTSCFDHFFVEVDLTTSWKTYSVYWDDPDLGQGGWGYSAGAFDPSEIVALEWFIPAPTNGEIWIDDIRFIEK